MPVADGTGVALHYESAGRGPTVLLIAGLGMAASGWWRTSRVLARSFRVLRFDNRGVGRSELGTSQSVRELADDALAVLDAAGVKRAYVYGISMGGMVAQELALRRPERVSALVLGATTAGGARAPRADHATVEFFRRAVSMAPEEAIWASVPYSYASNTKPDDVHRIAQDIARRMAAPIDRWVYARQVAAGIAHDALHRLGDINMPTLVVHGEQDRVVPLENARILAAAIPGARLETWPEAGHIYTTDEPRADLQVAGFLREQSGASLGRRIKRVLPAIH